MLESLAEALGTQAADLTALSFGIALLGGLIAGFGPCVLPMIPAIFGYLTRSISRGEGDDTRSVTVGSTRSVTARSLAITLVFVFGLATTSAAIGALAAGLGHAVLVGRWAYWIVAAICLVMGLQLLGVIQLDMSGLNRFVSRRPDAKGYHGAFAFGLVFGLVATPCSTPVLAVIATLAAATGDIPTGAGLLFVYGIGKGMPLLLVALFSGVVAGMKGFSRATVWMSRGGGAALVGLAAYLVWIV